MIEPRLRLLTALAALVLAAPAAGQGATAEQAKRAVSSRTVAVRAAGLSCPGCTVEAIPLPGTGPAAAQPGLCLENPVIERFEVGTERSPVYGALVDAPLLTAETAFARILLLAPTPDSTRQPAAIHSGSLCLPARLPGGIAFDKLGAYRDPMRGTDRGLFDTLLRVFGSDAERYSQLWVESDPTGAEVMIGNLGMPSRTNTTLAVTRKQLELVWLRYRGRKYPLAACQSRVSGRAGVARDYLCRVR